ncbi:hypothetical protein BSKO_03242 [Bryopsis sp. KO-2023]|nr:hypothetical protein BSKO_03242 [Bryopsis sp. KO-2023]
MASNGVYGPYLRFGSCDASKWTGSIMIARSCEYFDVPQACLSSPSFKTTKIQGFEVASHGGYCFWRFNVEIQLTNDQQEVQYSIKAKQDAVLSTGHSFFVPGIGQMFHWAAQSCSGFSSTIDPADWGGVGPLWKDILSKHEVNPFHAMVGGGDQIYCDSVFKVPILEEWLEKVDAGEKPDESGFFSTEMDKAATDHLVNLYLNHFASDGLSGALARIPHIMIWDDHDIFDGWGSYPEYLQLCSVFQGVYVVLRTFYLLFQHHCTYEMTQSQDSELFGPGSSFSYLRYFGPKVALVGVDIRAERTKEQVMSEEAWELLFEKMEEIPDTVDHMVMVLTVPLIYPKVPLSETIMRTLGTVNRWSLIHQILYKSGASKSLLKFNEPELLDDLWDHFKSVGHEDDRRRFVLRLQEFVKEKTIRASFVCGDVHTCGVGRFFTRPLVDVQYDPRLMMQIITSGIVNAPAPLSIIRLMHMFDTDVNEVDWRTREQMIPLFSDYKLNKVMGRRNWCEVEATSNDDFKGALKFTLWTENPKRIGKDLKPYAVIVPKLLPGHVEPPEEEVLVRLHHHWSGGPWD